MICLAATHRGCCSLRRDILDPLPGINIKSAVVVCSKFTLWFQVMAEWTTGKGLCETCHCNEAMFSGDIDSLLRLAIYSGHEDCFRQLLAAGADVNNVNPSGKTPVFCAVEAGMDRTLRMLIKAGADVNKPSTDGETPVFGAVETGRERPLRMLIKAGADVDKPSTDGETPIMRAVRCGHANCVKLLLQAGADVNSVCSPGFSTLFLLIEKGGSASFAELPINEGADVNEINKKGRTPLAHAIIEGSDDAVELLIRRGADVNKFTSYGSTALLEAVYCRYYTGINLLIKAGADVNAKDSNGCTSLINATIDVDIKCARLLLRAGAKVNMFNTKNRNALLQHIKFCGARFPKMGMLLFAAGDVVGGVILVNRHGWWGYLIPVPVSEYSPREGRVLCLMEICRSAIREHLLGIDLNENLFFKVPRLGLPKLLCSYLLFNVRIDDDDDNDDDDIITVD